MKRQIPLILTLLCCIPIWLSRSTSASLLTDSDTVGILTAIRERQAPLSWFSGDWPLGNHFYRPISTLSFELDHRLWGSQAAGYGATQALLAIACVLALYWFVRELVSPGFAGVAASVFALWHLDEGQLLAFLVPYVALVVLVIAIVRRLAMPVWAGGLDHLDKRRTWRNLDWSVLYGPLALVLLGSELLGQPLRSRMIEWLPGRTASVMTLFALVALAAYARYERLRPRQDSSRHASPFDLPATKSTDAPNATANPLVWGFVAVISLALALASYEQAVMVPAALLGVAILFSMQGKRPQWGWQVAFWGLLLGYLVLRRAVVPSDVSGYQAQQFRNGPGVWLSLSDYFVPAWRSLQSLLSSVDLGVSMVFLPGFNSWLAAIASNVAAVPMLKAVRSGFWALGGYALSCLAFLPMAWLKPFDHYHYWPEAMRTILVVALGWAAGTWCLRALSPPSYQAPPRPVDDQPKRRMARA